MSSDAKSEMSASEMAMRKFLKQLGVTGHQKLSDALDEAVRSGAVAPVARAGGDEHPVVWCVGRGHGGGDGRARGDRCAADG